MKKSKSSKRCKHRSRNKAIVRIWLIIATACINDNYAAVQYLLGNKPASRYAFVRAHLPLINNVIRYWSGNMCEDPKHIYERILPLP